MAVDTQDIERTLSGAIDPIKQVWEQAKQERERLRAEAAQLDEVIRRLERILRAAAPELLPKPHENGSSRRRPSISVSQEKVDAVEAAVRDWLTENDHVTINDLKSRLDFSPETLQRAMVLLRQRNVVRVSGRSAQGTGRAKHYRLTAEATNG